MKTQWKTFIKIGITAFALYLCIHYWPTVEGLFALLAATAQPLIIGCVIAYIVNILMSCYERLLFSRAKLNFWIRCSRPVSMLLAFITLIAAVTLIVCLIVPQLTACVQVIIAEIPDAANDFASWLKTLSIVPEDIISYISGIDWASQAQSIIQVVTSGFGSVLDVVITTVSSVFSWTATILVSVIFSIYLLGSKERIAGQFRKLGSRYLKPDWRGKIAHILSTLDDCFHRFIVGQCTEALILGVLCTVGMLIFRFPYATMIGALIGFTALIPVAGAYIGGALGAFMILTESPMKALLFIIFLVVLQQLEGNLVYPRVVGASIGLPGIWVLAAVTIGGGIAGITGMLLGVPIAAAAYRLLREDVIRRPARTE